ASHTCREAACCPQARDPPHVLYDLGAVRWRLGWQGRAIRVSHHLLLGRGMVAGPKNDAMPRAWGGIAGMGVIGAKTIGRRHTYRCEEQRRGSAHGRTNASSVDVVMHHACCSACPSPATCAAMAGAPSPGIVRKTSVFLVPAHTPVFPRP